MTSSRDEASWIEYLTTRWQPSGAEVGPGDDACVLASGRYALTTDTLVEHVDFERDWAPPEALGHKALASNLSDLAAMGARPRCCLLTLGIPEDCPDAFVEGLSSGMRALAEPQGIGLAGGDLSASPSGLFVTLALVGAQEHPPLLRRGGRPGDALYVSGPLGGPAGALRRLKSGERLCAFGAGAPPSDPGQALLDRIFRPPSQTALGLWLAERRVATACTDLSDGLQRDLARLCAASGCGAEVEAEAVPLEPLLPSSPRSELLRLCLLGGEEQVLLAAVPPDKEPELAHAPCRLYRLGRLAERAGRWLVWPDGRQEELPAEGFDHFAP